MAKCKNCEVEIQDELNICPHCGVQVKEEMSGESMVQEPELKVPVVQMQNQSKGEESNADNSPKSNSKAEAIFDKINNTHDATDECDEEDIRDNKLISVLAYLGILVIITIFVEPNSKFARFHASQGLNLFVCEIAYSILFTIISGVCITISFTLGQIISSILLLVNLFFLVLVIIGIINAVQGKAKELPFIGGLKILK
ncbi:MAG: hypothetical protein RR911_05600 [Oscillospiraceae bacterium]